MSNHLYTKDNSTVWACCESTIGPLCNYKIREHIGGIEFKILGYTVEYVSYKHLPRTIAVWRGNKLVKRLGK